MAEAEEGSVVSIASTLHSNLPSTFQIPYGFSVCSKKPDGLWVLSRDSESFFKEHAIDWINIRPYESSRKGSSMSSFIDRIVAKGVSLNIILKRCVNVKIRQSSSFGVLNSSFNPSSSDAGAPIQSTQISESTSFVILINQGNIEKKFDEYIDLFVNVLRNEVNCILYYILIMC